ncbi:hypothetical protein LS482_21460 [Sinomicrobium kalidii]|uniref:hypothetical protein n=1 Tax=Sinomicrobium kalidii TaxID=2900738 RepID=UPI001E4A7B5C|nr:hypothetical protein [Sinomicrobium kalidii]UGU16231.1 hypothetical protein LS482_21460 [Sinomicrobium kalidii]
MGFAVVPRSNPGEFFVLTGLYATFAVMNMAGPGCFREGKGEVSYRLQIRYNT